VTADELLRMPRGQVRRELVRGVVREFPLNGMRHGAVASRLLHFVGEHVRASGAGGECLVATGFQLEYDPDTVIAPDIAYVTQERADAAGPGDGYFPGPPDLAVEVLNEGEQPDEVLSKVHQWIDAGTPMVVIVDPMKCAVSVHRANGEAQVLTDEDMLPGWRLKVRDFFD
jgi:Uma2 family endonuclease